MNVFLDDRPVSPDFIEGRSLDEVLRYVQSDLCADDRLVIRLLCNGHEIAADEMQDTLEKPADSFDRLDVFTSTKAGLVADAMTEAEKSLRETEDACHEAGSLLNQGRTVEGIEMLGECLAVWQQIHDAVAKSIQLLRLDPDQIFIQDDPLSIVLGKPKNILTQIKQSLEARDLVLLADLLLYDLSEVTGQWLSIVDRLRDEAKDM